MKATDKIEQVLYGLAQEQPEALARLWHRYGIQKAPSTETAINAFIAFGDPFLVDLYRLWEQTESSFLGNLFGKNKADSSGSDMDAWVKETEGDFAKKQRQKDRAKQARDRGQQSGETWTKFKNTFTTVLGIINPAAGAAAAVAGGIGRGGDEMPPPIPVEKKILGLDPPLFVAIVVVVVAVTVIVLVKVFRGK